MVTSVIAAPMTEEQARFEADLAGRLRHVVKTARMWGSPDELEAVALHFTHVWLASRTSPWTFEQTVAHWSELAGPAPTDDHDEHRRLRQRLWGADEARAYEQVVLGFASIWADLQRAPDREARVGPWVETLLDEPRRVASPDRLNVVLFALMGFIAEVPGEFVGSLSSTRERVGGHSLRGLHVVGPPGPSEAQLTYTLHFKTWDAVAERIDRAIRTFSSAPGADAASSR